MTLLLSTIVARILLLAFSAFILVASPAQASEQVGDLDASAPSLKVDERGEALVAYQRADGTRREVLVWGAENALAPDSERPQVRFRFDYSGGRRTHGRTYPRAFRDSCGLYDGPALVFLVAACKAPDGSYWALQSWQRLLPLRGIAPFRPGQGSTELHLSHWSGPLAQLEVSPNWTYGGRWQGLFGRLTYLGLPVHGFRTPSPSRSDRHARYFHIDTFNSVYGPGWRRDAAKVTHKGNGAFCYSFVPQVTPRDYPSRDLRGPGNGDRHRVTVMGPGVTPIVQWEGAGLRSYDAGSDRVFNALFDRLVGPADDACTRER